MTKSKVALLTALLTSVVLVAVLAVAWGVLKAFDGLGREELLSDCAYDATLSGVQGYCVVVTRHPATPVHSERTYLEIAPVVLGHPVDHRFRAGYPFSASRAGEDLEVDWSRVEEQVVVTDPATGSSITYTFDQYGGTR